MPTKTKAKAGIGVLMKMGDGASPEVFATLGGVTNLEAGGVSLATEDATHLDSPDYYTEVIATLKTGQPWTATLQWNPDDATHDELTGVRAKLEARALTTFRIDTTAAELTKGIAIDGYVTELGNVTISPTGIMTQSFTVTPSGKPRVEAIASW